MTSAASLSVLIPNYNHARFLPRALEAVLAQSRPPDRIVVIDDASTDDSLAVLESFAGRHPNFEIVRNLANQGVVPNINRLIDLSGCSHGFFMAADDVILPGLFEKSLALLEAYPEAGLCSAMSRLIDEGGRDLGPLVTPIVRDRPGYVTPGEATAFLVQDGQWIINNTSIYRMRALSGIGGFEPKLAAYSDGFASDAIALRHGACFIPDFLACWRYNPEGFASRTCRDLDQITGIMRHALLLMRTRHADIFPRQYRDVFRRHLCKRYNPAIELATDDAS